MLKDLIGFTWSSERRLSGIHDGHALCRVIYHHGHKVRSIFDFSVISCFFQGIPPILFCFPPGRVVFLATWPPEGFQSAKERLTGTLAQSWSLLPLHRTPDDCWLYWFFFFFWWTAPSRVLFGGLPQSCPSCLEFTMAMLTYACMKLLWCFIESRELQGVERGRLEGPTTVRHFFLLSQSLDRVTSESVSNVHI